MQIQQVLGTNLQRVRQATQYTVGELSRRSGVSKQTIGTIESGNGNPTVETLAALADVLQVSVRSLMTEREEEYAVQRSGDAEWRRSAAAETRELSRVAGSGYVTSGLVRLTERSPASEQPGQGRGSLRHVIVVDGTAEIQAVGHAFVLSSLDFVRFAAELPHSFRALDGGALLHVVTTSPEQSMSVV